MEKSVFCTDEIVQATISISGYRKGDIFKVVDMRGLRPGTLANNNSTYFGVLYNKTTGKFSTRRMTIYHRDLTPVRDRKFRVPIITARLKSIEEESKRLKGELEYYNKYKSEDDYLADKIKEILEKKGADVKAIKKFLKERPDFLR